MHRARGAGPLRLLCPRKAGRAGWIVTSSLGGGLVDGDAVALEVDVHAGATCVITTQASTKVYRGTARQRLDVRVRGDALALVVPDPVVPFRGAHYVQTTAVALDGGASLVLSDVVTAGRVAFGECWSAAYLATTLDVGIAETRVLLDRLVLDPAHGPVAARMGRFEAIATAVLVGPRVAEVAQAQLARIARMPIERGAAVVIAGSPLRDGAVFRIAGERVEAVVHATRALLRDACAQAGEDPWSRRW
ncbi:MAG: urease accessory protein UreD [Myxococcota bacterium]|nr:urease accessory protein UreD [Myxococcota bacterium]